MLITSHNLERFLDYTNDGSGYAPFITESNGYFSEQIPDEMTEGNGERKNSRCAINLM